MILKKLSNNIDPMESDNLFSSDKAMQLNLRHHSRPITDLQFNRDGDLLFTASKTHEIAVCSLNGEVLNIYKGHEGAVSSLSISNDSSSFVSGGADRLYFRWDTITGKKISNLPLKSTVKHVHYKDLIFVTCDNSYSQKPVISVVDPNTNSVISTYFPETIPTSTLVDFSGNKIIYSDTNGNLTLVDLRKMEKVAQKQVHNSKINKIRPSWCSSFIITASNDAQSKIVDFEDLAVKKTFIAEEPLNDAAIFGTNDKVICAGGINARDVTVSRGKKEFDVLFFDIVTQKHVGFYSPHFGTINSVDIHPSTQMFCSGGEEAIICLMKIGKDFFENSGFTRLDD